MIARGEVSDDDLKRLGVNTIGERLNIRRISREASRKQIFRTLILGSLFYNCDYIINRQ
jgi:hypothetical protein